MGECILHGSGGSNPLNFKVVGGTSAPSNPRENTIWLNTDTEITSWDFSATQPYRRSRNKNLLTYPYYHTTRTDKGITFTDNGDGSVTADGTATSLARFRHSHTGAINGTICLQPGTYTLSGCPSGGSVDKYELELWDDKNNVEIVACHGDPVTFTITETTYVRESLLVVSGVTVSSIIFRPQLEKGSAATSFVKGDATGQVWFTTGTASNAEFNALKKNGLMVYPVSARQYIGGACVTKDAQIYKAGQWKNFMVYLYDNGIEYTNVAKFVASSDGGAVEFNDSNITVRPQNITTANGKWAYTDKNMDLSQLNTLVMMLSGATSYGGKCGFGVAPITPSGTDPAASAFTSIRTKTEQENINGTYFCDISSVNSGYVFFGGAKTLTNHASGGGAISMHACYLF